MSEDVFRRLSEEGRGDISLGLHELVRKLSPQPDFSETKVNANHEDWWTCVESGDIQAAQRLLDSGQAKIEATNEEGERALHVAARQKQIDMVRWLLEKSASVSARSETGSTPLHEAATAGCVEIVRDLVNAGADVTAQDLTEFHPWSNAFSLGHGEVMRLLASKTPPNLLYKLTLVDIVNRERPNPKTHVSNNHDPLHDACLTGNLKKTVSLLNKGMECNALSKNKPKHINNLIEDQDRPIHLAALMGHTKICKALLEAGAFPNIQDHQGRSPLSLAVFNLHEETVKVLIEGGADVLFHDALNRSMSEVALQAGGSSAFVRYLKQEQGHAQAREQEKGLDGALSPAVPRTSRSRI